MGLTTKETTAKFKIKSSKPISVKTSQELKVQAIKLKSRSSVLTNTNKTDKIQAKDFAAVATTKGLSASKTMLKGAGKNYAKLTFTEAVDNTEASDREKMITASQMEKSIYSPAQKKLAEAKLKVRYAAEKKINPKINTAPVQTRTAFSPYKTRRDLYHSQYKERKASMYASWRTKTINKIKQQKLYQAASAKLNKNKQFVAIKNVTSRSFYSIKSISLHFYRYTKMIAHSIMHLFGWIAVLPFVLLMIVVLAVSLHFSAQTTETPSPFGEEHYVITSPFGNRVHPIDGVILNHNGWDLAAVAGEGTPVYAITDGTVKVVDSNTGYGNRIIYQSEVKKDKDSIDILYGHLSAILVRKGEKIKAGQCIGLEGNTGKSTGPHLHLEIRIRGNPVDAFDYFPDIVNFADNGNLYSPDADRRKEEYKRESEQAQRKEKTYGK